MIKRSFTALLAVEGFTTKDSRRIEPGALVLEKPAVIRRKRAEDEEYAGPGGEITSIYRVGNAVYGKGWLDVERHEVGEVIAIELQMTETDFVDEVWNDLTILAMSRGTLAGGMFQDSQLASYPQACLVIEQI